MFKLDLLSMQSFCQKTPSYIHEKKPNHPYFHHVKGFFDISMYKKISLWITITVVFRTPCSWAHLMSPARSTTWASSPSSSSSSSSARLSSSSSLPPEESGNVVFSEFRFLDRLRRKGDDELGSWYARTQIVLNQIDAIKLSKGLWLILLNKARKCACSIWWLRSFAKGEEVLFRLNTGPAAQSWSSKS